MKWNFWRWLFLGLNAKPGYRKIIDFWFIFQLAISILLAHLVDVSLKEAASTLILPLSGIFVGLSFAWAGNAQALLQETEIERLADAHPDGLENYVYTFQLAILMILITLVCWGLAGLGLFEKSFFSSEILGFLIECFLYLLASLTLRECWHVVLGSQILILTRSKIREKNNNKEN